VSLKQIGPVLETERLILRLPRQEDLDGWAAFLGDEESARFIGGVQPRAQAWRSMASTAGSWLLQGFGMFSVIEKESGRWVGRLGPLRPDGWPGTEVGWGIAREAWGKGYATEGSAAAIDWVFDSLGWTEVIHAIDRENERSRAVARRLGSTLLRMEMLPPPFDLEPVEIWGQSREEWSARRAR
jgi:RimJ/RimL family protein N-acetyltransferase